MDEQHSEPDTSGLLNAHLTEYAALTNRLTYWVVLQYGIWPLVGIILALVAQLWDKFPHAALLWTGALLVQLVMMGYNQTLREMYNIVRYLERYLRPKIKTLTRSDRVWDWETYNAARHVYPAVGWEFVNAAGVLAMLLVVVYLRAPLTGPDAIGITLNIIAFVYLCAHLLGSVRLRREFLPAADAIQTFERDETQLQRDAAPQQPGRGQEDKIAPGKPMSNDAPTDAAIEVYKTYLADIGNIGTRHSDANKFYVSLLSALFVLLGLTTGNDKPLSPLFQDGVYALAVSLSIAWFLHLTMYAVLYRAKFRAVGTIEATFPATARPFTEEGRRLARYVPVTIIERLVPLLLTLPFFLVWHQQHPIWSCIVMIVDGLLLLALLIEGVRWFSKRPAKE